ncbi:Mu-like prophage I protein [Humidesulfovibrio mexicanus]|uniref:Mu-like prophage I protein n=1 Tax=Humidesulfovibrio mexicanus TaxID=147047 RepID=A0A239AIA9_9BACT|nr:phage protease [Humidesulfovibrio mexicanus]SNR95387.1 Mu-like prophage I protein [Humidesulfovibrio mexicanus]
MKRKPTDTTHNVAHLAMPLSGGVALSVSHPDMPEGMNAQLFPDGPFAARDGRPATATEGALSAWRMDADIAAALTAKVAARETPLPVDYEHQLILAKQNGKPAPASGWVEAVAYVPGRGLFAAVSWTAKAREHISADEYRYISPVFRFDQATGAVLEILSVALTNNPALDGMDAVALAALFPSASAATTTPPQTKETNMDELLERLRWLLNLPITATAEEIVAQLDKLKAQLTGGDDAAASVDLLALLKGLKEKDESIAALTAQVEKPDPAKYAPVAALANLQQANAALAAKLEQLANGAQVAKVDAVIQAALADGRLTAGLEPWARALGAKDEAALTAYLTAAAPVTALGSMQSSGLPGGQPPAGGSATAALSSEEIFVADQLGMTHAEFKTAKEAK